MLRFLKDQRQHLLTYFLGLTELYSIQGSRSLIDFLNIDYILRIFNIQDVEYCEGAFRGVHGPTSYGL